VDGRDAVVFCSNDYLGLARAPELAEAAAEGARRWGVGAGASRLIAGTFPLHVEVEARLAQFVGAEAALLFPSGYHANLAAVATAASEGDIIYSDSLNHASLIDGCRLARARVEIVPHRDVDALARLLRRHPKGACGWIVTESLFSMDGDEADLAALGKLAQLYGLGLLVDEAHALGVLGPHGRGLSVAAGISADLLVGTLGKAFGCGGAFVAGSRPAIELLANRARTFVFTTGLAPPIAAAVLRAVDLVIAADDRRERLLAHAATARATLAATGVPVLRGRGPILPIMLGADDTTMAFSQMLLDRGYYVQGIRPPTVPRGTSRLRLTLSSEHSAADVAGVCAALVELLGQNLHAAP
jgi:8-amino-7-oxononanoate synthase